MGMSFAKPHVIILDDMLAFIEHEGSVWRTYALDGWKRVEFRLDGGYRVTVRGRVVYKGTDGRSAVTAYNEAT